MRWVGLAMGVAIAGCSSTVTTFGGSGDGAGGHGGSANGQGAGSSEGGGGGCACSDATDCPAPMAECRVAVCADCTCGVELAEEGSACGSGGTCDGAGECVGATGAPCADGTSCASGFCVDGVCCESACDGVCESCGVAGSEGSCTPAEVGTDPEGECGGGVCDDYGACAKGDYHWSKAFGGNGDQTTSAIGATKDGGVVVVGDFERGVVIDGEVFSSAGGSDIFIARFDGSGKLAWAKTFGGAGDQVVHDMEVLDDGGVVLVGEFERRFDFGGGELTSAGGSDVFVARLDAAGEHVWSKRFGSNSSQYGRAVALTPKGGVVVAGMFQGSIDFGGGALSSAGNFDVFVAHFDGKGTHLWSRRFGDGNRQDAYGVAVDDEGNVAITGQYHGRIVADGAVLQSQGNGDVFVIALDADSNVTWVRGFGDGNEQFGRDVAFDGAGNLTAFGYFASSIDFGDGQLHKSAGGLDLFLVKLEGASGKPLWSKRFGAGGAQYARGLAHDAQDHIVIAGHGTGSWSFGGAPIQGSGGNDVYVAKLTVDGAHLWSRAFGGTSHQLGYAVATDATGAVLLGGSFTSAIDFGGGPHVATSYDAFLAKLGP